MFQILHVTYIFGAFYNHKTIHLHVTLELKKIYINYLLKWESYKKTEAIPVNNLCFSFNISLSLSDNLYLWQYGLSLCKDFSFLDLKYTSQLRNESVIIPA